MSFNRGFRVIGLCLLVVFGLVACGNSDEPALDLPPLTLPAPPTPVFAGTCTDTSTLERWLQTIQFQQRDFVELMDSAVSGGRASEALYLNVEQMALLRNRISEEPAPDCAENLHREILGIMQEVLDGFQEYVNGDNRNLNSLVENGHSRFNALLPQQTELLNRLDQQFQGQSGN